MEVTTSLEDLQNNGLPSDYAGRNASYQGLSQLASLGDGAMESRPANEHGRRTTDMMSDVAQELTQ